MFHIRQLGSGQIDIILKTLGVKTTAELMDRVIPNNIRCQIPGYRNYTEIEAIHHLHNTMNKNIVARSFIGMGYYSTRMPAVIKKNVFDNPTWYTAYTSYQT